MKKAIFWIIGIGAVAGLGYLAYKLFKTPTIEEFTEGTEDEETTTPPTPPLAPHIKRVVVKLIANKEILQSKGKGNRPGTLTSSTPVRRYPSDTGEISHYVNYGNIVGYALKTDYNATTINGFIHLLSGRFGVSGETPYIEKYVKKSEVKVQSEQEI